MKYPNLEAERARHGMTQDEFAKSVGVTETTYRNWQAGRNSMPLEKLCMFADSLDCSTDYLVGRLTR